MERALAAQGRSLRDDALEEMEAEWQGRSQKTVDSNAKGTKSHEDGTKDRSFDSITFWDPSTLSLSCLPFASYVPRVPSEDADLVKVHKTTPTCAVRVKSTGRSRSLVDRVHADARRHRYSLQLDDHRVLDDQVESLRRSRLPAISHESSGHFPLETQALCARSSDASAFRRSLQEARPQCAMHRNRTADQSLTSLAPLRRQRTGCGDRVVLSVALSSCVSLRVMPWPPCSCLRRFVYFVAFVPSPPDHHTLA